MLALPGDMRARFLRIADMPQEFGQHQVGLPHVRPLEGNLWEMRMQGFEGTSCAVYADIHGRRLLVLHVFIKKTQVAPRTSIETARKKTGERQMKTLDTFKAELLADPATRGL